MIISTQLSQLDEIIAIENISFEKPWTRSQIKDDIQANINSENWVFIEDEKVVGYIFGWIIQNEFHLYNIAVHPNHQRKKIARKLIQHIILRVAIQKVNVILLEVSVNNISARKCYQSLGFIQTGIRKDYYSKGDDAILYNLEIN
ncbi:MAG: ribosomal protein S18-alanine N-acetyltransferase [Candidatus Marinimicrobia bacterium]|nr:ribosomal protein S18-alanine N-acetyltransferase [Candidatus Neomarinimicrobiota bacterium]